jgi:hypothetical protein
VVSVAGIREWQAFDIPICLIIEYVYHVLYNVIVHMIAITSCLSFS